MPSEMLEIDGIRLTAPQGWKFQPFENAILAMRERAVGILQITKAFQHEIEPQSEHSEIQKLAFKFAGIADVSQVEALQTTEERFVKSASFSEKRTDSVNVYWYKLMPEGLILAAYKAEQSHDDQDRIRDKIEECGRLINSVQFSDSEN